MKVFVSWYDSIVIAATQLDYKIIFLISQILVLTFAFAVSAFPQYDDYDQAVVRGERQVNSQQLKPRSSEDSSTTTQIPIISQDKSQDTDGSYKQSYETGNNIIFEEEGTIKDVNEEHPDGILVQRGSYSYETPEGEVIETRNICMQLSISRILTFADRKRELRSRRARFSRQLRPIANTTTRVTWNSARSRSNLRRYSTSRGATQTKSQLCHRQGWATAIELSRLMDWKLVDVDDVEKFSY